jgi:glycosyltransferase involved in cell wall biosynthesis
LVVLGGPNVLEGYNKPNKIVAGIALMTHPSEWPNLCEQYPIAKYLQHSKWAKNIYVPYYGTEVCDTWFAGIETEKWIPVQQKKTIDVLIYNKIRWEQDHYNEVLKNPIIKMLEEKGLSYQEIIYGQYKESDYHTLLMNCKTMIFLCEHESQGFACCEALSMDVPVLAWDQGFCLDPNRFKWNDPIMPATSVPFFDDRCGEKFVDIEEFKEKLPLFLSKFAQEKYSPRQYVLENLSLAKSGERMLDIIDLTYGKSSK